MKTRILLITLLSSVALLGCASAQSHVQQEPILPTLTIPSPEIEAAPPITQIITTDRVLALTFNGVGDVAEMAQLLDLLDQLNIKATFFIQGAKIVQEPELIQELVMRGHSIQNNTLNYVLIEDLNYEQAYRELALSNRLFEQHFHLYPAFTRSRSNNSSEPFLLAAAQLNMNVVQATMNLPEKETDSAIEIAEYVSHNASRGGIISLNSALIEELTKTVKLINDEVEKLEYRLVSLEEAMVNQYTLHNKHETNQLQMNLNFQAIEPKFITTFETEEKYISLTIDDWASDQTISQVLDILDHYSIKATFFLIGSGVEKQPQLARAIRERGHEIASHTYYHQIVTEMEPNELQDDLIRTDEILTQALREKPANYFRPPTGEIDETSAQVISAAGVDYIVLVDVASWDWNLTISADEVFQRIVNNIEPGGIITMHILDNSHTLEVLPRAVEYLLAEGYQFKTIGEMLAE
ncbi:Peptidoglycan/xylan/chitin deacetylase, PgdA/CDA1 family [Amphibacillus marinus]|uniref:Peptidoglycan/xylan/chitin deacetylase, PgdA/CDA1 family n=1 Tax=Amphibacillus marinus TaxID=872970 RepID=A0A1H8MYD2_9BACI|nr:polysaccharide deacetylase family protein [Amphibacillus marinus]SEO22290.1 Peptidoglycan/xylan/chitin deacetylase, PgdA/CDA1 family [Amphibacillus marinus]